MNDPTIDSNRPAPSQGYLSVESRNGMVIMAVRCDMASLRHLRREIDERLASFLEPARRSELLVAVNEAATNAIESQQRNDVSVPIIVTIDPPNEVVIVDDHAGPLQEGAAHPAFRLDRVGGDVVLPEQALPEPSTQRGRGLHIMRTICPGVRIVSTDVGCSVELPWS